MRSPSDVMLDDFWTGSEDGHSDLTEKEEEDPFLKFVAYAKSVICTDEGDPNDDGTSSPSWSWIANRILLTCAAYSSGVTPAILLSELAMAWNEHSRSGAPKKESVDISMSRKKRWREKSPNTITIDSIYEKKFVSLNSVIEAVIIDAFTLAGTDIHILSLGDIWSCNTIDLYLHRRFYNIADPCNGILKKGREVLLTGCRLRVTTGNSRHIRLLPTEYFVTLLDEDEDDDAMLLGAQFCSDSFSSISLDCVSRGASYSLYARIENIGALEVLGKCGGLQRKQITLIDNDGARLKFFLWGEQVLIANLFSVRSMLAVHMPFISSNKDSSLEACDEICLEYGSATEFYLVPLTVHKEQVSVAFTQNHYQGSRLLCSSTLSEGRMVSQVELPCDSCGSIDFSKYPFRCCVADVHDKMTGVSLYGVVLDISSSLGMFSMRIEDDSGAIWVKLHLTGSWSLGIIDTGHSIFISGLSSALALDKSIELSWHENSTGSSLFNLSCLPVLLNSSCLHKISQLSDLSNSMKGTLVCRVWVDQIEYFNVEMRDMHTPCGRLLSNGDSECRFCQRICSAEIQRTFNVRITIADGTSKVVARCIGQTAAEILQISADEFHALPEEEQIIYPSASVLENEQYVVAIVNGKYQYPEVLLEQNPVPWEVISALKC